MSADHRGTDDARVHWLRRERHADRSRSISRTQSSLWFHSAIVEDALSGLRCAVHRRDLAPSEERQLVVRPGGEEPPVAPLDHRHRRAAILGQPLQVHAARQRDANEPGRGYVKRYLRLLILPP